MPGFTPGRRWQSAYSPLQNETFATEKLRAEETTAKAPVSVSLYQLAKFSNW
jgi:hypothetical protein